MINLDYILKLYEEFTQELLDLKEIQKKRYDALGHCQFDDIECEILYMLVRDKAPSKLIEFSPLRGWSTSWILEALNKNDSGELTSYDIQANSLTCLRGLCSEKMLDRWTFVCGDVQDSYKKFDLDALDFLFIDCVHTDEFCDKYITEVLIPAIGKNITCVVHDIFSTNFTESLAMKDFFVQNSIFATTAAYGFPSRGAINEKRKSLGLDKIQIHSSVKNPSAFFTL